MLNKCFNRFRDATLRSLYESKQSIAMFVSSTFVESDVVALHEVREAWDLRTDHLKEPSPIKASEETSEDI